ncbi:MAG: hypothetical protein OEM94_07455 [Acidimicrobiia bacterium]|nr:hypothetical protein [Acidimicrobiia bacterium]
MPADVGDIGLVCAIGTDAVDNLRLVGTGFVLRKEGKIGVRFRYEREENAANRVGVGRVNESSGTEFERA